MTKRPRLIKVGNGWKTEREVYWILSAWYTNLIPRLEERERKREQRTNVYAYDAVASRMEDGTARR